MKLRWDGGARAEADCPLKRILQLSRQEMMVVWNKVVPVRILKRGCLLDILRK